MVPFIVFRIFHDFSRRQPRRKRKKETNRPCHIRGSRSRSAFSGRTRETPARQNDDDDDDGTDGRTLALSSCTQKRALRRGRSMSIQARDTRSSSSSNSRAATAAAAAPAPATAAPATAVHKLTEGTLSGIAHHTSPGASQITTSPGASPTAGLTA